MNDNPIIFQQGDHTQAPKDFKPPQLTFPELMQLMSNGN